MQPLSVTLADRSYPIHIGAGLLDDVKMYSPYVASRCAAVVTNQVVAPLYLERTRRALVQAGARVVPVLIDDGEPAKTWASLDRVIDALLAARCGRDSVIVALGGGVVGELAGFAAAVYQRGIALIQVPTTLLAQVDSSVGGKTAINHARGKNMIGAFHQPLAVIADIATLDTLPDRELRAGMAEVIKHGFILDLQFVGWLEANIGKLLGRDRAALSHAVRRSCELKAQVVAADERETGLRAILNFGHTFGHAIETGLGYGAWLHGEAVAAGMVMGAELSRQLGFLSRADSERIRSLLQRAGLPTAAKGITPERMRRLMSVDKKAKEGRVHFVLLEKLGAASLRADVPPSALDHTLSRLTA